MRASYVVWFSCEAAEEHVRVVFLAECDVLLYSAEEVCALFSCGGNECGYADTDSDVVFCG